MSDVFSYSKINTFSNCRELYHINYIQKIRKKNDNIESYLGSCVHDVIEYIYNNKLDTITLDEIVDIYNQRWKERWHNNIYMPDRSKKPGPFSSITTKPGLSRLGFFSLDVLPSHSCLFGTRGYFHHVVSSPVWLGTRTKRLSLCFRWHYWCNSSGRHGKHSCKTFRGNWFDHSRRRCLMLRRSFNSFRRDTIGFSYSYDNSWVWLFDHFSSSK